MTTNRLRTHLTALLTFAARRCNQPANRVGGRVASPASHPIGHAGPRPAVPGSPCGITQHSFSATMVAAGSSANRLQRFRNKITDGRGCLAVSWAEAGLPAEVSPSRVVRPSGFVVLRLVALGTTASADS